MLLLSLAPAEVRWRIEALYPPRALRPCGGCGALRPFVPSGCFRVNAQKRRLDVWLVYRCADCHHTWNLEVLARTPASDVDPARLAAFHANDADEARAVAFDVARLVRAGARALPAGAIRVARPDGEWPGPHRGGPAVRIELATPCEVRLDRLLSTELGLSRTALERAVLDGSLSVEPGGAARLRRAVTEGLRIAHGRRGAAPAPNP